MIKEPKNYNESKNFLKSLFSNVDENRITVEELVLKINAKTLLLLTKPSFNNPDKSKIFANGVPISNGAVTGKLCTTTKAIELCLKEKNQVIYFSRKIESDEIFFFDKLAGLVAVETDPSSHVAIICKDQGLSFISKINSQIEIDEEGISLNGQSIKNGDWISMDAYSGEIFSSKQNLVNPKQIKELKALLKIIDKTKRLKVFGNADTPAEVTQALTNGADGVEPRTEHMFYDKNRLVDFQKAIILTDKEEILKILKKMEVEQIKDFTQILSAVKELPALIRLLDPPLHEFLPTNKTNIKKLASDIKVSYTNVVKKIHELTEVNPMSGHRGVRLLITFPELASMQINALFKAAVNLFKEENDFILRIVIPMVMENNEILEIKKLISRIHDEIKTKYKIDIKYKVGIMVETPRAAMTSALIAKNIDFISFGTNDLTAFIFGFSRGDVYEKFLIDYLEKGVLDADPFFTLDKSVSKMVSYTVKTMLKHNPLLESSICGEQGSDEKTIKFCDSIGMTSISCNPPKILLAKLFAAKAAIINGKKK